MQSIGTVVVSNGKEQGSFLTVSVSIGGGQGVIAVKVICKGHHHHAETRVR